MRCNPFQEIWQVTPLETPKIIKKCSRCSNDRFYSSDKFRINANKKLIDVWLIYKCVHCDATSNQSIISRTAVSKIKRDLWVKFEENDFALAWQYAFDLALLQPHVVLDWSIDFSVQLNMDDLAIEPKNKFILIQSDFYLKIPMGSILRQHLQLSRSQLEKQHQCGKLELLNLQGAVLTLKATLGKGCLLWKMI